MKKKKIIVFVLHTVLLLFILRFMTVLIIPRPYVYASENICNGIISYEAVMALQKLGCVCFAVNAVVAFATWFYSKTFFIIHILLAELCLAFTVTMMLM